MKIVLIVIQVIGLYLFYLAGSWIEAEFHLMIPGNIIGMLMLFVLLRFKIVKLEWFNRGASFLLSHLPLLFIPITVGVMEYFHLFQGRELLAVVVVLISTFFVLTGSGFIGQLAARRAERGQLE